MSLFKDDPYILYLCAASVILLTTILVKLSIVKYNIHRETGRKILHLVAVMTCAYVVYYTNARLELAYIFLGFSIVLFYIAHKNILLPSTRKSYGIALFPMSFGTLLLLPLDKMSIIFGIVTLGISDALAGLVGEHFARKKHVFLYESKSWLGFTTFYFCTVCIGYFFIGFTPILFILALIPALSELFSYRGSDNFTVPIIATLWLSILTNYVLPNETWIVFLSIVLVLIIIYYKKWLTMAGTTAAILLASMIIFSVGFKYLIPISIFFVVGSLTSKLHPKSKDASGRNAFQVFANGLVAVIAIIIYAFTKNELFIIAYFASVAISFADTLSSDVGIFFRHKTYDITSLQPTKVGISGGISFVGTIAGILGAFSLALIIKVMFELDYFSMCLIGLSGTLGMIVDSILGSLWQSKYKENDDITEEKTSTNQLINGFSWLNNDGVNILTNVIVVGFIIWITIV